ncbi:MAG: hypothetical protein LBJ86_07865, partial [Spirochaetaceae bacterium]|nr:hypothetical protein [Spirochaetaceae bacterium]
MKKFLFVMVMILPVFLTSACKSAPAAASDADVGDTSSIGDADLPGIYNAYSGIIGAGAQEHTVKYGDTLTGIARASYGEDNGYFFPLIMAASRLVSSD